MSQQKTKKQIQDKKVKEWHKQNKVGYKRKKKFYMKATNIIWDVDNKEDLELLPTEINIPDKMDKGDISDYLSDITGYCHKGYVLED